MKLLYCQDCGDLIKLKEKKPTSCECGKSGGMLLEASKASYYGDNATPIEVINRSFLSAIQNHAASKTAAYFDTFFTSENTNGWVKQEPIREDDEVGLYGFLGRC